MWGGDTAEELKADTNLEDLRSENIRLKETLSQLNSKLEELEARSIEAHYNSLEYFTMRLAEEVARANRYKYEFSIMMVEMDNIDKYEKRCGRMAVDEVLGMFNIIMQDVLRNTDLKCRLNNRKFGILLPNTDGNGALRAGEKARQAIERIFTLKSMASNIRLSVSIGIATYPHDAANAEKLLVSASEALAHAQKNGNVVSIASSTAETDEIRLQREFRLLQNDSFLSALEDEITRCSRYSLKFSILVLAVTNLENPKTKIDGMTRAQIMRGFFQKLKSSIRTIDKCYIYTDTRIAVIMPGTDAEGAVVVAQKLVGIFASTPVVKNSDREIYASINVGIADFPLDDITREGLLIKVEAALKHAAMQGVNKIVMASNLPNFKSHGQRDISEWLAILKEGGAGTIFNLLAVVDMTERYDPPHSQAVAKYAMAIGKIMGLDNIITRRLRLAAMLHDLGKVCVPPAILTKAEPLKDNEWEVLLKHPQYGSLILEQIPDYTYCCPILISHHEMWNGKGYPRGIKGDTIPLESRIIAVAEAFDDMITPRPYRSRVLIKDAINELKDKAGSQFDPSIVKAFLKAIY